MFFDLGDSDEPRVDVGAAPPVPDEAAAPSGQAMQLAAQLAARRPSRLARWFWGLAAALVTTAVSVAAWDFAVSLLARWPVLGWAVSAGLVALVIVVLLMVLRELATLGRLGRLDGLHRAAETALAEDDLEAARDLGERLLGFYHARSDTGWSRERVTEHMGEQFDARSVITLIEAELLAPLDAAASREVEAAARQVATVTAFVPLALADVLVALIANLRMIRRIATIYGGRSGLIGSWRLTRAVFAHLIATGAIAAGDDFIEPLVGGSLLGKLSRRFGEGAVNGALTARVGVAAMEVCRPLPFTRRKRPSVREVIRRALRGILPEKSG